jgi:hypothetical protein
VELDDRLRAGLLVKLVDVLGDDRCQIACFFELGQGLMTGVGLGPAYHWIADVSEEVPVVGRVLEEMVDIGVDIGIVLRPNPTLPSVGGDTAFCGNAGAGKGNGMFGVFDVFGDGLDGDSNK